MGKTRVLHRRASVAIGVLAVAALTAAALAVTAPAASDNALRLTPESDRSSRIWTPSWLRSRVA